MKISEIYRSIQGESTWAGRPCTFVRTAGCSLRCNYCDTGYALPFDSGDDMPLDAVIARVAELGLDLVEVTGGEPLEEPETPALCSALIERGATVLVETSGAFDIGQLPSEAIKIMDLKTPSSRMQRRNRFENIALLSPRDEVKFVIADRGDFDWSAGVCREQRLFDRCAAVHFSPSFGVLDPLELTDWILKEKIPARLQLQLHKYIWPPEQRGV